LETLKEFPGSSLDGVFVSGRVYNARPSFVPSGVMPGVADAWDERMGAMLCVLFDVVHIAPMGALTSLAEDLIERAGFRRVPVDQILRYSDRAGYESILERQPPGNMIVEHLHPENALDPTVYLIPRPLLASLIDKADLGQWVPDHFMPARFVVPRMQATEVVRKLGWSGGNCVLKTTGGVPTGGGFGVMRVPHGDRFAATLAALPGEGPVVVEHVYPVLRSFCVNLLIPETTKVPAKVFLLGAAEQWIRDETKFVGSRMCTDRKPWPETLEAAVQVGARVAEAGYRGILGVDVLETPSSGVRVIDINPRLNFSTAPLVLVRDLYRRLGSSVRFTAFNANLMRGMHSDGVAALRRLISQQRVFPFRWYAYPPGGELAARAGLIVASEDSKAFQASRDELAAAGFRFS
jgi:hypothetical protein